mgnify:CR=1 FL=1
MTIVDTRPRPSGSALAAAPGVLDRSEWETDALCRDLSTELFFSDDVDEIGVRKRRLRVLVQVLHVRVGRRRIEIEVVLLAIFAVVALVAREAVEPLLQDVIALVPEREPEAEPALAIRDREQAVLAPAIGARMAVLEGEEGPCIAVRGVVLTHGAPLSSRHIGAPQPPRVVVTRRLTEALVLIGRGSGVHHFNLVIWFAVRVPVTVRRAVTSIRPRRKSSPQSGLMGRAEAMPSVGPPARIRWRCLSLLTV